jgi:hypothetical protein
MRRRRRPKDAGTIAEAAAFATSETLDGASVKSLKTCTKCGAADVVRVPGEVGGYGACNNVRVGNPLQRVPVARYVCVECGYAEGWVDEPDDLRRVAERFRT